MTKRRQTLREAVSLLSWHSSCKNGVKAKQHVYQVAVEVITSEIKQVSNQFNQQYVTEDIHFQFGQELTETIKTTLPDIQQDLKPYVVRKLTNVNRQPFFCYLWLWRIGIYKENMSFSKGEKEPE
jgi:hypothetical protein